MYQIIYYFYPIMNSFEIRGGNPLNGEVIPQGAKNEALQILSAVLLSDEDITISNIPNILDVNVLIELLAEMGVKVTKQNYDTYTFNAAITFVLTDPLQIPVNSITANHYVFFRCCRCYLPIAEVRCIDERSGEVNPPAPTGRPAARLRTPAPPTSAPVLILAAAGQPAAALTSVSASSIGT